MKFDWKTTTLFIAPLLALAIPLAAQKGAAGVDLLNPGSLVETAPDRYTVALETSEGTIEIRVTRAWAPLGADRFYNLVKSGFYQDSRFFRVVRNFVAQFGLPADPVVGQIWADAYIRDDSRRRPNRRGTVAFATSGRNRRTTQLFINLKDNSALDQQGFAPIGQVTEGLGIVYKLNSAYGEAPKQGMILAQGNAYLNDNFWSPPPPVPQGTRRGFRPSNYCKTLSMASRWPLSRRVWGHHGSRLAIRNSEAAGSRYRRTGDPVRCGSGGGDCRGGSSNQRAAGSVSVLLVSVGARESRSSHQYGPGGPDQRGGDRH